MTRADPLFKLRLPAGLRRLLEEAAMTSGETLTGEILRRLEASFAAADQQAAMEARIAAIELEMDALRRRLAELERVVLEAARPPERD